MKKTHKDQATRVALTGIRILLVEDEVGVSRMYTNGLEQYGATVIVAHDGVHAMNVLEKEAVDIVILDLMMPRMNGYETLVRIRESVTHKRIPVIILTNLDQDKTKDVEEIKKLGVSDFLLKVDTTIVGLASKILLHVDTVSQTT